MKSVNKNVLFFHDEKRSQNIKTWWNQLPIYNISLHLPGVEPRSIAWKTIILTVYTNLKHDYKHLMLFSNFLQLF